MSEDPPRHQHSIQGREHIQMSSLPKKIVRKDKLSSEGSIDFLLI